MIIMNRFVRQEAINEQQCIMAGGVNNLLQKKVFKTNKN